jgi:tetratricopeptide (TPR) repeat protein
MLIFVAILEDPSIHLYSMTDLTRLAAEGNFKEAIEALKQNPNYDADYFFNLGILHGKMGQHGLAVAYLEKSNHDKPHDPEIQKNLQFARDSLSQHLASLNVEVSIDPASNRLERFSDRIDGDEILGMIGMVMVLVSLLWMRAYLKTRNIIKTLLKPSGWFGVLAVVLVFAFYGLYRSGGSNPPAVVINREVLRSGPAITYPEISPIEVGIKVRLVGSPATVNENELWQKVRYKNNLSAWLPFSSLLPL